MRRVVNEAPLAHREPGPVSKRELRSLERKTIEIVRDSMLCTLCLSSEEEWAKLTPSQRPTHHVYIRRLGWLSTIPIAGLN
jgi:hypothetical protein